MKEDVPSFIQTLTSALRNAPFGFIMFGEDMSVIDCNNTLLNMLGTTKKQYLANSAEYAPGCQPDGLSSAEKGETLLRRTLAGEQLKFDWTLRSEDGELIPCEVTTVCHHHPDEPYIALYYLKDMREVAGLRHEITQVQRYARYMLDAAPFSCLLWNTNGDLLDCNVAAVTLFGYTGKEELTEKWLEECTPELQPDGSNSYEKAIAYFKEALEKGYCTFEWMHRLPDGTPLPVEVDLALIEDGNELVIAQYTQDLRHIKSLEKVVDKAYYDSLTGLYNRRYFDEIFDRLKSSLIHSKSTLSLLLIDIDNFKLYNDTYGHNQGDVCLQAIADILLKCAARSDDIVVRYGGEEFLIALPNTDAAGANVVAERLLESVRDAKIEHLKSTVGDHVSISIGSVTAKVSAEQTRIDYISAADKMLYKAKNGGRGRYYGTGLTDG